MAFVRVDAGVSAQGGVKEIREKWGVDSLPSVLVFRGERKVRCPFLSLTLLFVSHERDMEKEDTMGQYADDGMYQSTFRSLSSMPFPPKRCGSGSKNRWKRSFLVRSLPLFLFFGFIHTLTPWFNNLCMAKPTLVRISSSILMVSSPPPHEASPPDHSRAVGTAYSLHQPSEIVRRSSRKTTRSD